MNMNFNQVEMVLFDSTIAQFKLSVKGTFTRERQDGSTANLVYKNTYTNNRTNKTVTTLNINPNIYLVFGYRGETYETSETLYTSFPQLFSIREQMEIIKNLMLDSNTFEDIEGVLEVKAEFKEPLIIDGIGRENNWISFGVATVENIDPESNIRNKVPGAVIQISSSNYASPMTAEEFLTVYTIVNDIDLSGIQMQLTMLAILNDNDRMPTYNAPAQQGYQQPAPRQTQYQQPNQSQGHGNNTYQPRSQTPSQPKYGNTPARNTFKSRQQPVLRSQPEDLSPQDYMDETQEEETRTQKGNLPPRKNEKNIVNMKNVEETPVASVNFNNPNAVDDIFNDDEE
jgi:hypothetical protein